MSLTVAASLCACGPAMARGVSPYLPLQTSPQIERQIEQVLILADKPVLTRPIAAATVLDALPEACKVDRLLCRSVRSYLSRYMREFGIDETSAAVATSDGALMMPNSYGMASDSAWRASAQAHWQVSDHVLLSLGGVAYEGDAMLTGTMLSLGFDVAQLDIGFKPYWLSPFTDSAMLISTQSKSMPSISLSNYRPLTPLGIQYQVFLAEMDFTDQIPFENRNTAGRPRLAGLHGAIEPAAGWSISATRLLQFGGGERGGGSFGDFWNALRNPRAYDNVGDLSADEQFGNQVAAWSSRFIFPGRTPFAAYLEYAGEDRSYGGDYRLGNAALSVGIHFPRLWQSFDLRIEASEWQNGWYVSNAYGDGLSNDGLVLGHWGADRRVFADGVGAQSQMIGLGWQTPWGALMEFTGRTLRNETYSGPAYERSYDFSLRYTTNWREFAVGIDLVTGRDVFGGDYSRLEGFVRLADQISNRGIDTTYAYADVPTADVFVDAGANISKVQIRLRDGTPATTTDVLMDGHIGIGARRAVSERSDLGVRAELDEVNGISLFAVRALDYRYRFRNPLALTAFVGAARYDLATPAYGYYFGAGAQWRDILPRMDFNLDLRYADKLARDKLLPQDPSTVPFADTAHDIYGVSVSLSYRW